MSWLGRVQHDLVKRMLWGARDRREVGGAVIAGELRAELVDGEGAAITAMALWEALRAEAPADFDPDALAAFGRALAEAVAAAERDDLAGVLALEDAFAALRNQANTEGRR
jgi:hypothetical protein